jgi:hypothetical protein
VYERFGLLNEETEMNDLRDFYDNDDDAYAAAMAYFDDLVGIPKGYYLDDDEAYAAAMIYFDGEVD